MKDWSVPVCSVFFLLISIYLALIVAIATASNSHLSSNKNLPESCLNPAAKYFIYRIVKSILIESIRIIVNQVLVTLAQKNIINPVLITLAEKQFSH